MYFSQLEIFELDLGIMSFIAFGFFLAISASENKVKPVSLE